MTFGQARLLASALAKDLIVEMHQQLYHSVLGAQGSREAINSELARLRRYLIGQDKAKAPAPAQNRMFVEEESRHQAPVFQSDEFIPISDVIAERVRSGRWKPDPSYSKLEVVE